MSSDSYGQTVLQVLRTPWPWASAHMSWGPTDCDVTPTKLHPAFHGSLDWHSSVHMQWSALRLLASGTLSAALHADLESELDSRLSRENCQVEATYLRQHPGWERPYGWGWALRLAAAAQETRWAEATAALVEPIAEGLRAWLPRLSYPIRHGVHTNTAFGLSLARQALSSLQREDDLAQLDLQARRLFVTDRDVDVRMEPSGHDFLSPALAEADLMRAVLGADCDAWLAQFLPHLDPLLTAPTVGDDSDGHAVHLYGLALSKAGQLRRLARYWPEPERVLAAAEDLVAFAAPQINDGDFMSTHWLVSFALLAHEA